MNLTCSSTLDVASQTLQLRTDICQQLDINTTAFFSAAVMFSHSRQLITDTGLLIRWLKLFDHLHICHVHQDVWANAAALQAEIQRLSPHPDNSGLALA